ncbi:hypothetical protein RIF29_14413 [Crotalaria pallida]|uniref:Uncharacterized protein n=1 Tax=Crotalaria pallida TaxID=3830 RepID=A0AAN9FD96_CROPI
MNSAGSVKVARREHVSISVAYLEDYGHWDVKQTKWLWEGPARIEIIDPDLVVSGRMMDVTPCVMYLRDQVTGGPYSFHELHPAMRRMDFEDISDGEEDPSTASESEEDVASEKEIEEFQEEDQEDVVEEEENEDPHVMEMPNI